MREFDRQMEFFKLMTPEERRRWIEGLNEQAQGKSHLSEQAHAIASALNLLGRRYNKDSVLKVMAKVLGVEPVEKDGIYRVGDWQVRFDKDNKFHLMSANSGVLGIVQDTTNRDRKT